MTCTRWLKGTKYYYCFSFSFNTYIAGFKVVAKKTKNKKQNIKKQQTKYHINNNWLNFLMNAIMWLINSNWFPSTKSIIIFFLFWFIQISAHIFQWHKKFYKLNLYVCLLINLLNTICFDVCTNWGFFFYQNHIEICNKVFSNAIKRV